jgi:hypothetical protein
MRSDIVPGATFPDYELPDHTERTPETEQSGRTAAKLTDSRNRKMNMPTLEFQFD